MGEPAHEVDRRKQVAAKPHRYVPGIGIGNVLFHLPPPALGRDFRKLRESWGIRERIDPGCRPVGSIGIPCRHACFPAFTVHDNEAPPAAPPCGLNASPRTFYRESPTPLNEVMLIAGIPNRHTRNPSRRRLRWLESFPARDNPLSGRRSRERPLGSVLGRFPGSPVA